MEIKGYFKCVEDRLKCLAPILPYLETKEGIATPLRLGAEVHPNEIVERMIDIYEEYWQEDEMDEMIIFFQSAPGQKLMLGAKDLSCKLLTVLEDYIVEKMQDANERKMH